MGIEDYEFLTRTMEEISEQSTKLANKKRGMYDFAKEIKIKSKQYKQMGKDLIDKGKTFEALIEKNKGDKSFSTNSSTISSNLGDLENKIKTLEDRRTKEERGMEKSILIPWARAYNSEREGQDPEVPDILTMAVVVFLLTAVILIPLTQTVILGFQCDNGDIVDIYDVDDGRNDCGDNSDENLSELTAEQIAEIAWKDFVFSVGLFSFFWFPLLVTTVDRLNERRIKKQTHSLRAEIDELEMQRSELAKADALLKEMDEGLQTVTGLEEWAKTATTRISDMPKEIKRVEENIAALWDSIAHLIPFSTALEKA